MFIVNSYSLAVVFCFITMMCWGSWGNTQKLASRSWRYELFYWDYVIGMLLFSLVISFTMGSFGQEGRPFLEDLAQVKMSNVLSVIIGGVIRISCFPHRHPSPACLWRSRSESDCP